MDLSEISDIIPSFFLVKQVVPSSSFWGKPIPVDDHMTNTTLLSLRKLFLYPEYKALQYKLYMGFTASEIKGLLSCCTSHILAV